MGVKGQKIAQNDKILSVALDVSRTIHKCKMISPGVFLFFKILILGLFGGSKGKKWPKMTENSVLCTLNLRNHA